MPPARAVLRPMRPSREHDLVVRLGAGPARRREPVPHLDPFHRLDAHQGERQARVELAVVVHVRAEPGRRAVRHHLEDPAHGVLRPADPVDLGDHLVRRRLVDAPDGRGVDRVQVRRAPERRDRAGTFTDPIWTTWESTPIPTSARNALQHAPTATRAAVSRALARSKTLRTSSNPYFWAPTRSAWPGRGRVRRASGSSAPSTAIRSAYFASNSTFGIVIATGAPRLLPWRTPRQDLEPVGLEPLPATATVAVAAARQLSGDLLRDDAHARRQTLQDRDQRLPVGFAGREHAQHADILRDRLRRLDGAGAAPRRGRPRAGDRSPRGRIAGT